MQALTNSPTPISQQTGNSTNLYLIAGDVVYWVSAMSPTRAIEIVIHEFGVAEEFAEQAPSIRVCTRASVGGHRFTFEDGETCGLWNAFELVRGFECVLASDCM
jgi:hypothetical protein